MKLRLFPVPDGASGLKRKRQIRAFSKFRRKSERLQSADFVLDRFPVRKGIGISVIFFKITV